MQSAEARIHLTTYPRSILCHVQEAHATKLTEAAQALSRLQAEAMAAQKDLDAHRRQATEAAELAKDRIHLLESELSNAQSQAADLERQLLHSNKQLESTERAQEANAAEAQRLREQVLTVNAELAQQEGGQERAPVGQAGCQQPFKEQVGNEASTAPAVELHVTSGMPQSDLQPALEAEECMPQGVAVASPTERRMPGIPISFAEDDMTPGKVGPAEGSTSPSRAAVSSPAQSAALASFVVDEPMSPGTPTCSTAPHNVTATLRALLDEKDGQVEELLQQLEAAEVRINKLQARLCMQEEAAAVQLLQHQEVAAAQLAVLQDRKAALQASTDAAAAVATERLLAQQAEAADTMAQLKQDLLAAHECERAQTTQAEAAKWARYQAKMDELREDVDEAQAQEQRLMQALECCRDQGTASIGGDREGVIDASRNHDLDGPLKDHLVPDLGEQAIIPHLQARVEELEGQLAALCAGVPSGTKQEPAALHTTSMAGDTEPGTAVLKNAEGDVQHNVAAAHVTSTTLKDKPDAIAQDLAHTRAELALLQEEAAAMLAKLTDARAQCLAAEKKLETAQAQLQDAEAQVAVARTQAELAKCAAEEAVGAREGLQTMLADALDKAEQAMVSNHNALLSSLIMAGKPGDECEFFGARFLLAQQSVSRSLQEPAPSLIAKRQLRLAT